MSMEHYDDLISDQHVLDDPLDPDEYNALAQVLDTQVEGALEGLGAGMLQGGAVTAGSGLSVNCAPLIAVVETDKGMVFVKSAGVVAVSLPDDTAALYLWLQALLPDTSDYDSRRDASASVVYTLTSAAPSNALPLARVATAGGVTTVLEDLRQWSPARSAESLVDRIAVIESALGPAYISDTPPADDVGTRLDDLEGIVGGGSGDLVYAKLLPWTPTDSRTNEQVMDAKDAAAIAAHVAELHGGTTPTQGNTVEPWSIDANNQARHLLKYTRSVDQRAPETQVDSIVVVWGVYGDGSNGSPDFVDRVNSTWEFS